MLVGAADTETTGVDPEQDRIVTASVVVVDEDLQTQVEYNWLINPGVEIPQGAIAIHGITNEIAQAQGTDPAEAIPDIISVLSGLVERGVVLTAFNAPFDLTLLDRESRRHTGAGLPPALLHPVLDPLVIDKGIDQFRKGKRTLTVTAAHYGVAVPENAHTASADALMAGQLAQVMLKRLEHRPRKSGHDLPLVEYLHRQQVGWAVDRAEGLQDYLRRTKDQNAVVNGQWPMIEFGGSDE